MNHDFWIGLAVIPAAVGAATIAVAVLAYSGRTASFIIDKVLGVSHHRLTPDDSRLKRATLAGAVFGAPKTWWFAFGNTAFVVISGIDHAEAVEATDRLSRVPMGRVTVSPRLRATADSDSER